MFILLGERAVASTENLGPFQCPICQTQKELHRVTHKNYFTVLFIRILPLGIIADYNQCSGCGHTYNQALTTEPLFFSPTRSVLAYLLSGFGLERTMDIGAKVFKAVTGTEATTAEIQAQITRINQGEDLFEQLKKSSPTLSWLDKSLIVEAAFLLIFASQTIEYEERLRINLIGNALGISIEEIKLIIDNLQAQQYKGIRAMEIAAY